MTFQLLLGRNHALYQHVSLTRLARFVIPISPRTSGGDFPRSAPALSPSVRAYLAEIVREHSTPAGPLVSLILFGSAATGGYAAPGSDVDLLLVLNDAADAAAHATVRDGVADIERRHGLVKTRTQPTGTLAAVLVAFVDRVTANTRSFFLCTRADFLSGEPRRILGIPAAQARFVDRTAMPSIVRSATTVWGEDLLAEVPFAPIRRFDVWKAFFGLWNQLLLTVLVFPLLPGATKYAMDALKRSVHNCYFCHHGWPAPLAAEVAFFEGRYGPMPPLRELLALRHTYRSSFPFVLRCLPTLARLHAHTARDVSFPFDLRREARDRDPRPLRPNTGCC